MIQAPRMKKGTDLGGAGELIRMTQTAHLNFFQIVRMKLNIAAQELPSELEAENQIHSR